MKAIALIVVCCLLGGSLPVTAGQPPLRVESAVPATRQPHANNPNVIWYDDFDQDRLGSYLEPAAGSPEARRSTSEGLGGRGGSMECFYPKGGQGIGNRKLVFGDAPMGRPLRKGEKFMDMYWRLYVKHQSGWEGEPAKLSRATGMVSPRWNQAFISHVWSSGLPLTLDPVTGVRDGQVITEKYNDFEHFRWLGNRPVGRFPLHSTEESGRWVCVESRIRLNRPGEKDGYAALWVDGRLDTERTGLDLRGTYTGPGSAVNAIFLEAYWNDGSPKDQYRWYDDFVVSTAPIGPVTAEANPGLLRTAAADLTGWELEIAADPDGKDVVWRSGLLSAEQTRVTAGADTGKFVGSAAGIGALAGGHTYFCRIREQAGEWSTWHQPFSIAKSQGVD